MDSLLVEINQSINFIENGIGFIAGVLIVWYACWLFRDGRR